MAESEVPLDLQRQIEALEDDSPTEWDVSGFVRARPEELPETCPECGAPLTAVSVFVGVDDEAVATRMVCKGTHGRGRVASYIYEVATGELYLEREETPERATEGEP